MIRPLWIEEARKILLERAGPGAGWSYRLGLPAYAEPTAMAILALGATEESGAAPPPAVLDASRWLASLQKSNGAVGLSTEWDSPEWPTALAVLAWASLGSFKAEIERAANWLIGEKGKTYDADSKQDVGHDPSIPGWPWVGGTHSWLEPTAMAMMALKRCGLRKHTRVHDGLRLIRDRALATGGWNIGNSSVRGTVLRPQPSLTGLALVAMRGLQGRDEIAEKACLRLEDSLPGVRAAQALGWGLLGLQAWDIHPPDGGRWMDEAFAAAVGRADSAPQVSYLLLAAGSRPLTLLGAEEAK
jgi:hypothetical protein